MEGAKIVILSTGSTEMAVEEARAALQQHGIPTDFMRVRAVPFTDDVEQFIRDHDRVYVVEINRDGQLAQLLTITMPELAGKIIKAAHLDGLPLTARWVKEEILAQEEK